MEEDLAVCPVCISDASTPFVTFSRCGHTFCQLCVQTYFQCTVKNGGSNLSCLLCSVAATESEVMLYLQPDTYQKYLMLSLRRYLALQSNVRSCVAPDCPFIYLLENPSDCTDDHFICQNETCGIEFCYQCKKPWHEGMLCHTEARSEDLAVHNGLTRDEMKSLNIKMCPRCATVAEKVDDGACNHVKCSMCELEFCWLCLRPSSELHFLSPTGCPMYGRRRWSLWKRWLLRISLWIGAPLLLFLLSLIVFFISLVAVPCLVGYLVYQIDGVQGLRITIMVIAIIIMIVLSPLISLLLALIVFPLGYFYVYIFVPIHLLRTYTGRNRIPVP